MFECLVYIVGVKCLFSFYVFCVIMILPLQSIITKIKILISKYQLNPQYIKTVLIKLKFKN